MPFLRKVVPGTPSLQLRLAISLLVAQVSFPSLSKISSSLQIPLTTTSLFLENSVVQLLIPRVTCLFLAA